MADKSKFTALDAAASQLGVSKEKLNELREAGQLRAYRDGTSWKFRTDDIQKLVADPSLLEPEPSDILGGPSEELPSLELESELELETLPEISAETSDIGLADIDEPTVAEGRDAAAEDEGSILLSEDELGDSSDRPASTIIGRSQLRNEPSDDDLLLAEDSPAAPGMSDVRLADEELDADLLGASAGSNAGAFDDLEELEIDLEAESSRILDQQDVAAAQAAAKAQLQTPDEDSLSLADSDISLDIEPDSGSEASGLKPPTLDETPSDADMELDLSGSGIELKPDGSDEMVLDSDEDSFALTSEDSGINLKPSDSGLELDDASFGLGGSQIGSSLDLGDALSDVSISGQPSGVGSNDSFGLSSESLGLDDDSLGLDDSVSLDDSGGLDDSINLGGESSVSLDGSTAFASSPDFNLQPGEEELEDEEDSSQVIALDAMEEPLGEEEGISMGSAIAGSPAAMGAQAPVMMPEASFPAWIVAFLGLSVVLMSVASIMAVDLLTSIWGYSKSQTLDSPLIQGFLGLIGLG